MDPLEEQDVAVQGTSNKTVSLRVLGIVAAAAVVALAAMYGWNAVSERRLEEQVRVADAQRAADRQALLQRAQGLYAKRADEALAQFSIPFGWAVRREMMAGNLDQVDQYFTTLVQMPGFERALVAGPDGKILVASDRKQLAQPFDSLYPAALLQAEKIQVQRQPSGNVIAVVPIMGLSQKLGTAVIEAKPGPFNLE